MKTPILCFRKNALIGTALVLLAFTGCATDEGMPGARADFFAFLTKNVTTRTEVILHLGQPAGTLEQERILTYRIGEDSKKGYYLISPRDHLLRAWESARYSLVLVFNSEGVLQEQSLVLVK